MQESFLRQSDPVMSESILLQQYSLLNRYAENNAVHIIDVRYEHMGNTDARLLEVSQRNSEYRVFIKKKDSAFSSLTGPAIEDQSMTVDSEKVFRDG